MRPSPHIIGSLSALYFGAMSRPPGLFVAVTVAGRLHHYGFPVAWHPGCSQLARPAVYDWIAGLDLGDLAVDGCMIKRPAVAW